MRGYLHQLMCTAEYVHKYIHRYVCSTRRISNITGAYGVQPRTHSEKKGNHGLSLPSLCRSRPNRRKKKERKKHQASTEIRTKSKKPRTYTAFLHASHTPQQ